MTLLLTLDDGSTQRKLADAVDFARGAVLEGAPGGQVGAHVGAHREDAVTLSHLFEAQVPGYLGWRWSVTVALAGDEEPVTVSEVVLVPGPEAMVAPAWVPWEQRVRAGDLGVGDIFPTDKDDPRLAPAYLQSDDPAVEEVAHEAGLGRVHVLSRYGREDAATRWHAGEFGPRSDMARSAPDVCGTCGFFVPLAGSLRGTFGACTNDIAPADGHVVDVAYGCGAHSEIEVEVTSSVPVAELVYDDSLLDFAPEPEAPAAEEAVVAEPAEAPAEPEAAVTEEVVAEPEAPVVEEAAETPVAEPEAAPAETEPEVAEAVVAEPIEAETPAEPDVPEAVVEAEPETAEVPEAAVTEEVAVEPEPVVEAEPEAVADILVEPVVEEQPEPEAEAAEVESVEVEAPAEPEVPEAIVVEVEPEIAEVPEAEEVVAEVELEAIAEIVVEPVVEEQSEVETAEVEAPEAVVEETVEAEVPEAVTEAAVVTETEPVDQTAEAGEVTGDQRDA